MTKKFVRKNGRLDDDTYGSFNRRIDDLKRRVDENTLGFFWVMDRLQNIIEGKGEFESAPILRLTKEPVRARQFNWAQTMDSLCRRTNHVDQAALALLDRYSDRTMAVRNNNYLQKQ